MIAQSPSSPIIVALDVSSRLSALALAHQLDPAVCRLKIGKELFTAEGPQMIKAIHDLNFAVFLDLKFHDIPVTVAKAVRAAADLGVWMVNVHASGGPHMMLAAAEALANYQHKPLLIAVTLLTSLSQEEFATIGGVGSIADQVLHLAKLSHQSGLDGVVCSAQEAMAIKRVTASNFLAVTPGIRPENSQAQDQVRIMTPIAALQQASDYLVIGRPISQASNPAKACAEIAQSFTHWQQGICNDSSHHH